MFRKYDVRIHEDDARICYPGGQSPIGSRAIILWILRPFGTQNDGLYPYLIAIRLTMLAELLLTRTT